MRTTLTLDPDVAERIRQEMRRTGKGLKALVNESLRAGLGISGSIRKPTRFRVKPHPLGLRPGIDPSRLNQLADELEVEELARRMRR